MEKKSDLRKQLRTSMVILAVIILPGLGKTFGSDAFAGVRTVDVLILFASGVATGSLIMMARMYYRLNRGDE